MNRNSTTLKETFETARQNYSKKNYYSENLFDTLKICF